MCNGILGDLTALGIAVILAAGIAACDSKVTVDQASRQQQRVGPSPQWTAARSHGLRAEVDGMRGKVWMLQADGLELYDVTSGEKLRSFPLPAWIRVDDLYACSPGLALAPNGDVLVTSNVVPAVWRVNAANFEVTRHDLAIDDDRGKDIGFAGLAYSSREGVFFAINALDGTLWWIDASLVRAQRVALSVPMPAGCGLSVLSAATPPGVLCVQMDVGDWTLEVAPDHRSAYVRAKQCAAGGTVSSRAMEDARAGQ